MSSARQLSVAGMIAAGALLLPAPARAALIIGGDVAIIPNILEFTNVTGLAAASHADGFGSSDFAYGVLPASPTLLDLSQSFSSTDGTSSSSVSLTSSTSGSGISVLASPPTLSLSQTDLSADPNGPAQLQLILAIPFTYVSANATETVYFDLDFDVTSNIAALAASDSFTLQSCIFAGDQLVIGLGAAAFANGCANEGATATTLASLGSGATLPAADPVGPFSLVVSTNVQYIANFAIDYQIQNDTGPTTLSTDGFSLTVSDVPEPGTGSLGLLVSTAAIGVHLRRRRVGEGWSAGR